MPNEPLTIGSVVYQNDGPNPLYAYRAEFTEDGRTWTPVPVTMDVLSEKCRDLTIEMEPVGETGQPTPGFLRVFAYNQNTLEESGPSNLKPVPEVDINPVLQLAVIALVIFELGRRFFR